MTDHHDFGFDHDDHPFDDHPYDPLPPYEEPHLDDVWDHHDDLPAADEHPAEPLDGTDAPVPDEHLDPADPVAVLGDEPVDVFPPAVDVGELPEPVDGFPWIDPAGLGAAAPIAPEDPVHPQDLAAYAGTDADSWAALRASDDPATSALARWWSPEN